MNKAEQKIRRMIIQAGGDWRRLNASQLEVIGRMTYECQIPYSRIVEIAGTGFRTAVWRAEDIYAKNLIKRQFHETGTVVIDRLGVEMA